MKKLISILMSLVMTVTLCVGFGQTAAAAPDYDKEIAALEKEIKDDEEQLKWYKSHADSSKGYKYTGFSEVIMESPFIIKTNGFPYGTVSKCYIRITNPSYSSDCYNVSILGTYYSSYVKPLGTCTYTYNGSSVPDYQFVDIHTYAPEIQKLTGSIESNKIFLKALKNEKKTFEEKKKADYFVFQGSKSDYLKVNEVEVSVKKKVNFNVGYLNLKGNLCDSSEQFTWKSSDTSIAKVNSNGIVTGVKNGTATITGNGKETGNSVSLTVKVNKNPTKTINLAKEKLSIGCGKVYTMKYTIDSSSNDVVHFYSSNENVAWVTDDGKIHTVYPGTANIAAYTKHGAKAYCKITVTKKNAPKEDDEYKAVMAAVAYHTDRIDPDGMYEYYVYAEDINKKNITVSVYDFDEQIECQIVNSCGDYENNEYIYTTAEYTYSISNKSIPKKTMREDYGVYSYKGDYCKAKSIYLTTNPELDDEVLVGTTAEMIINVNGRSYGERSTWTSSNESVATVSPKGFVEFKAPGAVTITYKMEGGAKSTKKFTVVDHIEEPAPEQDNSQTSVSEDTDDYVYYSNEETNEADYDDYYDYGYDDYYDDYSDDNYYGWLRS